jgi:predicted HTH transcriptional regulator
MPQLALFSALQSSTEGIDTEFKSARGGMPGSFWASYAAMANTQGGTIVLGVSDGMHIGEQSKWGPYASVSARSSCRVMTADFSSVANCPFAIRE